MIDEAAGEFDKDDTPPTREEQEAEAWEYWHHRATDAEGDNATLRAALEQIRTVCIDNGGPNVKHDMALKFVCQVAANALLETSPNTKGQPSND